MQAPGCLGAESISGTTDYCVIRGTEELTVLLSSDASGTHSDLLTLLGGVLQECEGDCDSHDEVRMCRNGAADEMFELAV